VINWVNEGKLRAYTTPGGHRRINRYDLVKFMQGHRMPIPDKIRRKAKRVLIIDNDPKALQEFKYALSGDGLELDVATNGFEAGRKIYRRKPDLILLDFKMPGMNGFRACEALRTDKETADIPIIAVTALDTPQQRRRIKACGAKAYVAKPLDIEKISKLIKRALKL
jgi:CheY-like chemotaxis protein